MCWRDDRLRRNQDKQVLDEPFVVITASSSARSNGSERRLNSLGARRGTKAAPYLQTVRLLLHEHRLVLVVTKPSEVAVVGPIEEFAALVGAFAGEQVALVVASGAP